ncbi:MAG: endonuclease III [Tepidisphaeraceae bacterium]
MPTRPRKVLAPVHIELPKRPFDIDEVMRRLRTAVEPYEPAAMFKLADEGFSTVFEVLVACIISIRTLEEVTIPTSRKLFAVARKPSEIARLSVSQLDELISACTFHETKAHTIRDIATYAVRHHDDTLPCDYDVLTSLRGVGPKCANLVLGIACNDPHGIGVDIHVHRVTNRWGIVAGSTPEKTRIALEKVLPQEFWVEINRLLVPFGKHVCTGRAPKCSTCPLLDHCRQVGVTTHR